MKTNSRIIAALLLATVLLCVSCRHKTLMNRTADVPRPWHYNDAVCFDTRITDTSQSCRLTFVLKHTDDFEWMNSFFFITTVFPDMSTSTDTLECIMADASGRWYGSRFGKYYSMSVIYKEGIRFPMPGEYRFEIKHGMRCDTLPGICTVGLKVSR